MSADTLDLIRRLYVSGAVVAVTPTGTLKLSGDPLPAGLLAEVRVAKADLLALLTAQGFSTGDDGGDNATARRYVVPHACLAPRACMRLGPCSQFLMRTACDHSQPVYRTAREAASMAKKPETTPIREEPLTPTGSDGAFPGEFKL